MTPPQPPPPPPDPQPYRIINYPNFFLGSLAYGDPITIVPTTGAAITAALMDLTPYGVTVWHDGKLVHARWDRIVRLEWNPPA